MPLPALPVPAALKPRLRVGVLAYEGCLASEIFGLTDVVRVGMRVANAGFSATPPDLDVRVITARTSLKVKSAAGVELTIAPATEPVDVIVVPGFDSAVDAAGLFAANMRLRPEVDYIRSAHRVGTQMVSVCAGAFLLAEAGVLDGRKATTSWIHAPALRSGYPLIDVTDDQLVVHDRGVSTAAAFTAMFDVTLHLLRATIGEKSAELTARIMLLDDARTEQTPYVDERLLAPRGGSFGAAVQRWLRDRLDEPFDLSATAAHFCVSQRTLSRKFLRDTGKSPLGFVQDERLRRAKHLLASTDQSVQEVARHVGYQDASTFSQLFRDRVGVTPREYRSRFLSTAS